MIHDIRRYLKDILHLRENRLRRFWKKENDINNLKKQYIGSTT